MQIIIDRDILINSVKEKQGNKELTSGSQRKY